MKLEDLVNKGILDLSPYKPGKPIEDLERELGITNAIKLASNENPLGPSPLAIDAVKKLKPCTYTFKKSFNEHDAGGTHQGFIAHEVQEAIPNTREIVALSLR